MILIKIMFNKKIVKRILWRKKRKRKQHNLPKYYNIFCDGWIFVVKHCFVFVVG